MNTSSSTSLTYTPSPNEASIYEYLFSIAAENKSVVLGSDAVPLVATSKVPIPVLKQLWIMADSQKANALSKQDFFVLIRLIQLFQNEEKPVPNNNDLRFVVSGKTQDQLKPPYFEGITTTQQQQQQQPTEQSHSPQQQQHSHQLTVADPYTMTPQDKARFDAIFPEYANKDGYLYGKEAVLLFSKSGLNPTQLRQIWSLVDTQPVDNRLDSIEFALAMHLIVCVSKKQLPMPDMLPPVLLSWKQATTQHQQKTSPLYGPVTNYNLSSPPPLMPYYDQQQQSPILTSPPPSTATYPVQQQQQQPAPPMNTMPSSRVSISDAFSDLDTTVLPAATNTTTNALTSFSSTLPTTKEELQEQANKAAAAYAGASLASEPTTTLENNNNNKYPMAPPMEIHFHPPPPAAVTAYPQPPIVVSNAINNNNTTSSSDAELVKLQSVVQQLRAENISLKAQLSSFSEEERIVRVEIHKTLEEITSLQTELSATREAVSKAKASLTDANCEWKALQQNKVIVTDWLEAERDMLTCLTDAAVMRKKETTTQDLLLGEQQQQQQSAFFGGNNAMMDERPNLDSPLDNIVADPKPAAEDVYPITSSSYPTSTSYPTSDSYGTSSHHSYQSYGPPVTSFGSGPPQDIAPASTTNTNSSWQFELMGGSAPAEHTTAPILQLGSRDSFVDAAALGHNEDDAAADLSARIEKLKAEVNTCVEISEAADTEQFHLAKRAEELKKAAAQAEKEAQEISESLNKKKGSVFGGGKDKKKQKEFEKAAQKAAEARKKAKDAEIRLGAAQSTALQLRHQVMEKRHAVEQAEMEAATMASIKDQRNVPAFPSSSDAASVHQYPQSNGEEMKNPGWGNPGLQYGTNGGYYTESLPVAETNGTGFTNTHATGWGVMAGKPAAASGNGIPSPSNSVNGDDDPFRF